jgi:hypothetical protein
MPTSSEDIAAIFAKDPLTLTKDDLSQVVEKFRAQRAQFAAGGVRAAKAPKEKSTDLDLDHIGL